MTRRVKEGLDAVRRQIRRFDLSLLDLTELEEVYRSLPEREAKRTLLTKPALIEVIVWLEVDIREGRHGPEFRRRSDSRQRDQAAGS